MRRFEAVQITLPPDQVETIKKIAASRRVPQAIVYREAVALLLHTLADEPAPSPAPTVGADHAPGRPRASARAHPWRGSAVVPRVIPGGRRER